MEVRKRQADWLDDLAEAVEELQRQVEEPLTFEQLAENEGFMDAVVTATRASHATHQKEKLAALRNGVLNTLYARALPSTSKPALPNGRGDDWGPP